MKEQIKKLASDPDYQNINPEIVEMARTNGYLKSVMMLYLSGQLTWLEALETMVIATVKEFRAQQAILVNTLANDKDQSSLFLNSNAGKLIKSLPPRSLASIEAARDTKGTHS